MIFGHIQSVMLNRSNDYSSTSFRMSTLNQKDATIFTKICFQIRKGMVMVSPKLNPQACWEFEGDIMVLHHPTTIQTRYQVRRKSEYRTFKMWKHLDNLFGF